MNPHTPVAIVGGMGYIGQAFHLYLTEQGIASWIVGRQSVLESHPLSRAGYRSSKLGLEKAISGAGTVVHAATLTTPALGEENPILEADNIRFTLALTEACIKEKTHHLIFVSSGGTVYGEAHKPISEDDLTNPKCFYGLGKLTSERYLRLFNEKASINVTILRISNPYGGQQLKKGGQGVVSYIINSFLENKEILLYGNTIRDYIYIEDVLNAFRFVIDQPMGFQIYNVSTGIGTSLVNLSEMISQFLNKKSRIVVGERRPFDLVYNVLKNDLARSRLGWTPYFSLENGLKKHISQLKLSW